MLPLVIVTVAMAVSHQVYQMQNLMECSRQLRDVYTGNLPVSQVRKISAENPEVMCPKLHS